MNKITKYAAAALLLCGVSTAVSAQDSKEEFKPYWFAGVQAGAQTTFTNYSSLKMVTPQFAIQAGRWMAPEFGARLHVMGYQQKGGIAQGQYGLDEQTYKFKACTADIDFLFNMSNIINPNRPCKAFDWVLLAGFGANYGWDFDEFKTLTYDIDFLFNMSNIINPNRPCKAFDWVLLAGFGANYGWDFDEFKTLTYGNDFQSNHPDYHEQVCGTKHSTFNGRLGTQFNYNVCEKFTVGLELQANYKNDLYNLKVNDRSDWQVVALLGATYNFGCKKKEKPVPVVEPIYETRVDTVWYDDISYKTVETPAEIRRDIHYTIRKSDPISEKMVSEIADFVKSHKDVKVSVTGYADKGTGNPRINMGYSKQRAEGVTEALINAGVPAEIITTDWKGDTVQPFEENDDNRVAITVASGKGEKKEKVVKRKYRLEEKRVRVN